MLSILVLEHATTHRIAPQAPLLTKHLIFSQFDEFFHCCLKPEIFRSLGLFWDPHPCTPQQADAMCQAVTWLVKKVPRVTTQGAQEPGLKTSSLYTGAGTDFVQENTSISNTFGRAEVHSHRSERGQVTKLINKWGFECGGGKKTEERKGSRREEEGTGQHGWGPKRPLAQG